MLVSLWTADFPPQHPYDRRSCSSRPLVPALSHAQDTRAQLPRQRRHRAEVGLVKIERNRDTTLTATRAHGRGPGHSQHGAIPNNRSASQCATKRTRGEKRKEKLFT